MFPHPPTFSVSFKYCLGNAIMTSVIIMFVKQEFLDFMAKHDFQADQALVVANKLALIDITTVKEILCYFSSGPTVYAIWDGVPERKSMVTTWPNSGICS